jgi:prephenate dehydratase
MKIGIQGIRGSYHDKVAKCYFGDSVSVQEFLSFDDLAISVSNNDSDFGYYGNRKLDSRLNNS